MRLRSGLTAAVLLKRLRITCEGGDLREVEQLQWSARRVAERLRVRSVVLPRSRCGSRRGRAMARESITSKTCFHKNDSHSFFQKRIFCVLRKLILLIHELESFSLLRLETRLCITGSLKTCMLSKQPYAQTILQ
jgi:hypothetical protein